MGLSRVRLRRAMERYAVVDALDLNCWRGRGASLLAGAASRCKTAPQASYCCAAVTAARKSDWRNIDRRSRAVRRTETRASPGADVGESRRRYIQRWRSLARSGTSERMAGAAKRAVKASSARPSGAVGHLWAGGRKGRASVTLQPYAEGSPFRAAARAAFESRCEKTTRANKTSNVTHSNS